jgi:CubicO group peptidase (beta-lactamase class C family)
MKYTSLFLLIIIGLSYNALGQNLIEIEPAKHKIHLANMGKITFMQEIIPLEAYKESDFLKIYNLSGKEDLNIRTFLANSLTNEMHNLAPTLTVEQLNLKGNFQFTFFVDNDLIYQENLHYGAFGLENKNKTTVFRIPLISKKKEDSWGRFLWQRFMVNGGEDALDSGEHLLRIEIRPYVEYLKEIKTGSIIAQGELKIMNNAQKREVYAKSVKINPVEKHPDWKISQERYDTTLIKQLKQKIITKKFKDITSIVVIKNNEILIDEYFNGANRKKLHDTRSVGKSFVSTLTGLALENGYIKNIKQNLKEFYPINTYANYSPQKDSITIEDLLTMRSGLAGFDFDENSLGNEDKMYPTPNWVQFALNLPMDTQRIKGKDWAYFTAGVVVLGDILHKSTPAGLEKFAEDKLFEPLNIQKYQWEYTPQKVVNTAGGLRLTSLDLAKFGQLYQNNGIWKGKKILSETWIKESLKGYTQTTDNKMYGYLFWNRDYLIQNKPINAFYASGNGGNRVCIFKDQSLVIVITSKAFNKPYAHPQTDRIIEKYILPAVL